MNKTFQKILLAFMTVIFLSMISYLFLQGAYNIIKENLIREAIKNYPCLAWKWKENMYDVYKLIYNAKK